MLTYVRPARIKMQPARGEAAADGIPHIPLPPGTFRAVMNVLVTLKYASGDTAATITRVGNQVLSQ